MAAKETDEFNSRPTTFVENDGTSLRATLDIARRFGVVKDSTLAFGSGKLFAGEPDTFYAVASQLKIASYFNLFKNFSEWRLWLATNGPILAALQVDRTWDDAELTGRLLDTFQPNTVRGGHAVSIGG